MRRFFYDFNQLPSSIRYWLKRRVTRPGWFVLVGLVVSAMFGLDTEQSLTYQAFPFLLLLLGISVASCRFFRVRFKAQRILPRYATVGEPFAYRVVVLNEGRKVEAGLAVMDNLADPRPAYEEFVHTPVPGEEQRSWFERSIGSYRWIWLVSRSQQATVREVPLPAVGPRGRAEVQIEMTPSQRGHLRFTGVSVTRQDPFGLFKASVTLPSNQSVLVLPRRYAVPDIQLSGTRKYQHGGVGLASSVGDSEEFISLRDYRPGDPLRRIHWKSFAKKGKPVVKEHQEEFFVRQALILDTFLDTDHREILEEAVSVGASFACSILTQESLLDLLFVGPEAYCFTAGRGVGHTDRMLEILACVRACRERPFSALHHLVLRRQSLLSGCICILLSWDEDRQRLIRQLQALQVPILVLLIAQAGSSPSGASDSLTDKPVWFHRLEAGRIAEGLAKL